MSLARWQATIVDEQGNVQAGASVEVRLESTGNLVAIKSDRAGATGQANPGTADADGYFAFHAVGGSYKIVATKGAFTRTWRYVALGTAAETDVPVGGSRTHTAAGDATFTAADLCLVINKTVAAATNVNIPLAADRNGLDVMIKDGKGDALTNNITPVFAGGELCDGMTGAEVKIASNRGLLWMRPTPEGDGYLLMPSQL